MWLSGFHERRRLLMEGMWLLLQGHHAEAELRRHRDQLEQLVKERAAELVVAHEALQHSHADYNGLYNGMADGLLIADLKTRRFVRANAAICRMLDCSGGDSPSMSVMGVPLVADSPAVWDEFRGSWPKAKVGDRRMCHPARGWHGPPRQRHDQSYRLQRTAFPGGLLPRHHRTQNAEEALLRERRILKYLLESSDHERQLISYEIHDGSPPSSSPAKATRSMRLPFSRTIIPSRRPGP